MAGGKTSSDSFGKQQRMLFVELDVSHIGAFVRRIFGAELTSFFDEEVMSVPQLADGLLKHDPDSVAFFLRTVLAIQTGVG